MGEEPEGHAEIDYGLERKLFEAGDVDCLAVVAQPISAIESEMEYGIDRSAYGLVFQVVSYAPEVHSLDVQSTKFRTSLAY